MPPYSELVNHSTKELQAKTLELEKAASEFEPKKADTISELADSINAALGFSSLETDAYVNFAVVKAIAYKQTETYFKDKFAEDPSSITPADVMSLSQARASFRREIESIGEDEIILPSGDECYRFRYEDSTDEKGSKNAVHLLTIEHLEGRITDEFIRRRLEDDNPNFHDKPPMQQAGDVLKYISENVVWRVAGETGKLDGMNETRKARFAADYIKAHPMYDSHTIVDAIEVDIEKVMQSVVDYIDTRKDLSEQVEQAHFNRVAAPLAKKALSSTVSVGR